MKVRAVQILTACLVGSPVLTGLAPALAAASLPPLKQVAEIRALSPEEAARSHPVRLRGVVTFYDTNTDALFIQDSSAGIYASPLSDFPIKPGDKVELSGVSGPGDYAPVVLDAQVQLTGRGPLPDPIQSSVDHLRTGREDSQWVQIEAFVRSSRVEEGQLVLKLAAGGEQFAATIPYNTDAAAGAGLVDARVKVTGVCGTLFDQRRQLKGIKLYVPDLSHVQLEETPGGDPFSLAVRPVASLVQFNPYRVPGHRVRVQGTVTLQRADGTLFLRDETDSLFARGEHLPMVKPGDVVDLVGFPEFNPFTPQLDDVAVRVLRSGSLPSPTPVTVAQVTDGSFDAELVQMDAQLLDHRNLPSEQTLVLESGGVVFKAQLRSPESGAYLPDLRPGSQVRLTGICSIQKSSTHEPVGFRLLLRSADDVQVLQPPSWWTPDRIQHALAVVAVLASCGLLWVFALHVRVRLQTRVIQERLERETALEQRYRDIFENANDAIFTHTPDGTLTSLNRVGQRILGYTSDEALQLNVRDLVAPECLAEAERITSRKLAGEELPAHTLDVITRTGQRVTLEVNSRPIRKDGEAIGIQGIARDISERRRAEQALRDSEERYRGLFEISPLPMWIYEVETLAFLAVNRAAIEHYGYSADEFLSMTLNDIRPEGQLPRMGGNSPQTDTSFGGTAIWKHRKKDGTLIYVEVASSPTEFAGRNARMILINDVTQRQRLEDHVRQLQKMESIGQLAAGVAHDFNNLLTVIRGHSDMLNVHGFLDPAIREPLREISQATERASNLTRQLLMFSRKQVMQPRSLNLSEVVNNLARLLRRTLGEHVDLRVNTPGDLPPVFADTGMMEQVITNLAVNARDAMPKGGQLTVETGLVNLTERDVQRNQEARPGRFVCLSVTDTGCGMDTTTMTRIFEPFFTTKAVGKGTGLGLATVYGIVKQHQGWVEVSSRQGDGSAFRVFLPVCRQAVAAPNQDQPSSIFPRGTETILLAEDEGPLRELSTQVLQRLGYRVLSAASGVRALEIWREHASEIDMLLTDMVMPEGVSGRDLAERVRTDRPDLKILFVSGYNVELVGDNFALHEGVDFLPKPYNPQALLRAVRQCLDAETRPASVAKRETAEVC